MWCHWPKIEERSEWIAMDPSVVHIRASDGRGPLWWAYEYGQTAAIELMLAAGVDPEAKDSDVNPARVIKGRSNVWGAVCTNELPTHSVYKPFASPQTIAVT